MIVGQWPPSCQAVAQQQATVKAKAAQIDAAIAACMLSGKLSPNDPLVVGWNAFKARTDAFLAFECFFLTVTDNDLEVGRQLEREMVDWFDRLASKGCMGDVPRPSAPGAQWQLGDLFKGAGGLLMLAILYQLSRGGRL